jgi:hypothetical protein
LVRTSESIRSAMGGNNVRSVEVGQGKRAF